LGDLRIDGQDLHFDFEIAARGPDVLHPDRDPRTTRHRSLDRDEADQLLHARHLILVRCSARRDETRVLGQQLAETRQEIPIGAIPWMISPHRVSITLEHPGGSRMKPNAHGKESDKGQADLPAQTGLGTEQGPTRQT
jgi:hypothetical protein